MSRKFAVVDLGTNTFHLLVIQASKYRSSWKEIYRERVFVHLAEEGIQKIGPVPFNRGLDTLRRFDQQCKELQVDDAQASGTAALRTASNGSEFVEKAKSLFSYPINIIDGQKEASLISAGVSLAVPPTENLQLIMDIGGGSVEFILKKKTDVLWARSFPIGVAVLKKRFHQQEPIAKNEIKALELFLSEKLEDLTSTLSKYKEPIDLIGASGTFDVLEVMLPTLSSNAKHSKLELTTFQGLYQKMILSTLEDRHSWEGLPAQRASLIVVAFILIHKVFDIQSFDHLFVSKYAMKEGILASMVAKL